MNKTSRETIASSYAGYTTPELELMNKARGSGCLPIMDELHRRAQADIDLTKIPRGYTGCEVYRGHVIALKDGAYSVFWVDDQRLSYLKGGFAERCLARAAIDLEYR